MSKGFALVTGASRGIGLEICKKLLGRGYEVWGISRSACKIEAGSFRHVELDLTQSTIVESFISGPLASRLSDEFGHSLLVNNACVLGDVLPFYKMEDCSAFDRQLSLQLSQPLRLAKAFISERLACTIVNISSGAAVSAYSGWLSYCVPKAGLRMMGEVMARDLLNGNQATGSRVLTYDPGPTATGMQDEVRASNPNDFPMRSKFCDLLAKAALHDPELVAADVIATALRGGPLYMEKRYGRGVIKEFDKGE